MKKCKKCIYKEYRERCLECEQKDEFVKIKHIDRIYHKIIQHNDIPFPRLDYYERGIWVMHLAKLTHVEIAEIMSSSEKTISRYLVRIKEKLAS